MNRGLMKTIQSGILIKGYCLLAALFLVMALAGVGLSTNFRSLKALGIKPLIVGLTSSGAVGALSFVSIKVIGNILTY